MKWGQSGAVLTRVRIPSPGSHILSLVCRCLPGDWTERCRTNPVLTEPFVEIPRHVGTVYQASGQVNVGLTQGGGTTAGTRSSTSPGRSSG